MAKKNAMRQIRVWIGNAQQHPPDCFLISVAFVLFILSTCRKFPAASRERKVVWIFGPGAETSSRRANICSAEEKSVKELLPRYNSALAAAAAAKEKKKSLEVWGLARAEKANLNFLLCIQRAGCGCCGVYYLIFTLGARVNLIGLCNIKRRVSRLCNIGKEKNLHNMTRSEQSEA